MQVMNFKIPVQSMVMVKGRWAQGLMPRNFIWIIKDRIAVSERPGGFARNHRKIRRQEELIWLDIHGFTRVVSLLESPHNLHAYNDAKLHFEHIPLSRPDEYPDRLLFVYMQLDRFISDSRHKILVHHEEFGDRILGLMGGYLIYSGLASSGPEAIQIIESITSRELQAEGREIISITIENRLMKDFAKEHFEKRENHAEVQRLARIDLVRKQQLDAQKRAQVEAARKRAQTLAAAEIARVAFVAEKKKAAEEKRRLNKLRIIQAKKDAIKKAAQEKKEAAQKVREAKIEAQQKAKEAAKAAILKAKEAAKIAKEKEREAKQVATEKAKIAKEKERLRAVKAKEKAKEKARLAKEKIALKKATDLKAKSKKTPTKKAVAKKVASKKMPVKKTSVKNKPLPKKATAKKATAKKAAAKKTPVKKAPVKKAPVKKAPAKKTAAKNTTAKKTPVKKTDSKQSKLTTSTKRATKAKPKAKAKKK